MKEAATIAQAARAARGIVDPSAAQLTDAQRMQDEFYRLPWWGKRRFMAAVLGGGAEVGK
jgi:hypothetical protein